MKRAGEREKGREKGRKGERKGGRERERERFCSVFTRGGYGRAVWKERGGEGGSGDEE